MGQKRKISAIFLSSARTNGYTIAKRKVQNRKSKTIVYYGDVLSMFGWTLMGVWWTLGEIHSVEKHTLYLEMKPSRLRSISFFLIFT